MSTDIGSDPTFALAKDEAGVADGWIYLIYASEKYDHKVNT